MTRRKVKKVLVCEPHSCPCVWGVGRKRCIVCDCITAEGPPINARPLMGTIGDRPELFIPNVHGAIVPNQNIHVFAQTNANAAVVARETAWRLNRQATQGAHMSVVTDVENEVKHVEALAKAKVIAELAAVRKVLADAPELVKALEDKIQALLAKL